jgi:hypothetical protein
MVSVSIGRYAEILSSAQFAQRSFGAISTITSRFLPLLQSSAFGTSQ